MIGPFRQPPDEPYLFTIEESAILVAKIRAGQIGRGEIVLGGSFGPEGSALITGRHAALDVDNARPLDKQQIARRSCVLQRNKWIEISNGGGDRLDAGVVDVCFIQCRRAIG